ncbi:hypothetical protein HID58_057080 [Brassica napus]|uniref:Uncharacterized protein n=1 Tax=Brassica napus TaxID=3708 RepID=A0ABQ8ARD6_BRANA|nr:hypothetical protein HID58_057080 [Brassica napus]
MRYILHPILEELQTHKSHLHPSRISNFLKSSSLPNLFHRLCLSIFFSTQHYRSMSIIVTTTITITFNAPISISSFSASVSEAVSATITKTSAAVTIIFISTSSFSTPSSNSVSTTLFIYPLIKASSFPGFDFMDREEEVELIMGLVVVLVPVEGAGYEEAVMVEMEQSKKKKKRKREKERRQRRKEDDEDGGGGATKQDDGKKEAV